MWNIEKGARDKDDEEDEISGDRGDSGGQNYQEISVNGHSNHNPDTGKLEEEEEWKDDKAVNEDSRVAGHQRGEGLFGGNLKNEEDEKDSINNCHGDEVDVGGGVDINVVPDFSPDNDRKNIAYEANGTDADANRNTAHPDENVWNRCRS